jgi:hypothetical protein
MAVPDYDDRQVWNPIAFAEKVQMARAKIRGIYEKTKGSGIWWIRWTDADHKKRREKAGRYSDAGILLAKRKTEKLQALGITQIRP